MQCRNCASTRTTRFMDLGSLPPAGGFLNEAALDGPAKIFDLSLYICDECGLIQVEHAVDAELLFSEYSFATGTVPDLIRHFESYADSMVRSFDPRRVLEFGCNDCTFLGLLKQRGIDVLGVDPATNLGEAQRAQGVPVTVSAFTKEVAEKLREEGGPVDVVTGSNCFAHIETPEAALEAVMTVLADDGVFLVEAIYALDVLEKLQWDTLYHEHLVTYSLQSLERRIAPFGLRVIDVWRVPMHAGSIRVAMSPNPMRRPSDRVEAMRKLEAATGVNRSEVWTEFGRNAKRQVRDVHDGLKALADKGSEIWAYGASGRATMWLNAANLTMVSKVVDHAPLRYGKWVPGLKIPIVPPEVMRRNPPDIALITAWNYADLIREKESWFSGRWCVPAPEFKYL